MRINRIIRRTIDEHHDGVHVVGGVNASVSATVDESGTSSHASTHQRVHIVQRGDTTEVVEDHGRTDEREGHEAD
jgi:hypothetical protein